MKYIILIGIICLTFIGCTKPIPQEQVTKPITISITLNDNISQTVIVK